jgi:zinc transport system permease protein
MTRRAISIRRAPIIMSDFLLRALLAGSAVALAAGPVGSFVIWRRMAYYGSAVSHSALLGVALGLLLDLDITVAVTGFCILAALMLVALRHWSQLPQDSLIGILAEVMLAGGLVAIALVRGVRVDLLGYLFGDVLAVGPNDLIVIGIVAAAALTALVFLWRPLLSSTVQPELARVEGVKVQRVEIAFMMLVAGVVAAGMRVVGILLIVALLIIPAAAARRLSKTPEMMAALAALIGIVAVSLGLLLSAQFDLEAGPAIVLVAGALFLLSLAVPTARQAPRA